MLLIDQKFEILNLPMSAPEQMERAGRTCYKSEDKMNEMSSDRFCRIIIKRHHSAMVEFAGDIVVKFITNRGVTHELVRHRLCSFAQENTRYVNYGSDHIKFIKPTWSSLKVGYYNHPERVSGDFAEVLFIKSCLQSELHYKDLLVTGWRPEQAREVLPNALKTEIVVKANVREWRHIFEQRCSLQAHPQMRELMLPLMKRCQECMPALFGDL